MAWEDNPNVKAAIEEEGPVGEFSPTDKWVAERIIHILKIYPKVSVSMLQVGVGTSLAPKMWKPILEEMINAKIISRTQVSATTPEGRMGVHTVISLVATK